MSKRSEDKERERHDSFIGVRGAVTQVLNGSVLRVVLPNGKHVLAHLSGRIRNRFVRIQEGDIVGLELSPYNLNKARVTLEPGALT